MADSDRKGPDHISVLAMMVTLPLLFSLTAFSVVRSGESRRERNAAIAQTRILVGLSHRYVKSDDLLPALPLLAQAREIARSAELPALIALASCERAGAWIALQELDSANADLVFAKVALAESHPTPADDIVASCFEAAGQYQVAIGSTDLGAKLLQQAAEYSARDSLSRMQSSSR